MSKLAYVSDEHVTEKDGKKEYHDTLDVSTSIHGDGKDTVMTVNNFPVKIFARYIPENVDTKDLKDALKKYEMPVSFKSVVYYYTVTPFIQFMLFPDAITVNLEYGGATHKVKFYCYSSGNSRYTFGQVTQDKSKVEAYLVVSSHPLDQLRNHKQPNKLQSKRNKEVRNLHLQKNIYVNTLLKIKQKKKTIRGAVFVRRLRLVTYIQRTLLLLTELPDMRSSVIWSIMMLISFKYLALSRF